MPKLDDSSSKSIKLGTGVYCTLVKIIRIEDKSVHPRYKDGRETKFKSGNPIELYLMVTYDNGDFERKLNLFGSYKKDAVTGAIKGWKRKKNAVQDFLVELVGKSAVETNLNEDYSIKPELLNTLIGREFYRISFVSGTWTNPNTNETQPNYRDWQRVFSANTDMDDIEKEWKESSKYMTKLYTPDVISDDTSFNYGANAPQTENNTTPSDDDVI